MTIKMKERIPIIGIRSFLMGEISSTKAYFPFLLPIVQFQL